MHLEVYVIFSLVFVVANAYATARNDGSRVVDELLDILNGNINQRHFNSLSLPTAIDDGFFFNKVFQNGTLKDFGTFRRRGNASITPTRQGDEVNWVLESKVGLQTLLLDTDYSLTTLFGLLRYRGHIWIEAKDNTLDVELTVVTNSRLGTCTIVVNELAVVDLGDFYVEISNAGLVKIVLEHAIEHLVVYVVPLVKDNINQQLHEFIRTFPINPVITKYICKYFTPQ